MGEDAEQVQEPNWSQLAMHVTVRRLEMGYKTIVAFAEAIAISPRTILKLEQGEPVGPRTLETVQAFLRWTAGDPQKVLEGRGDPTVVDDNDPTPHFAPNLDDPIERELWGKKLPAKEKEIFILNYRAKTRPPTPPGAGAPRTDRQDDAGGRRRTG